MSSQPNPPRRVPLKDAAGYVPCSVDTLRRRIADGTLTAYRLGTRRLVDLDELDALVVADALSPRIRLAGGAQGSTTRARLVEVGDAEHHPGHDTEAAAARSAARRAPTRRGAVLALLRLYPDGLTDDETAHLLGDGWDRHDVARRRGELVTLGDVVDTGHRRPSARGQAAIVWAAPGGAR